MKFIQSAKVCMVVVFFLLTVTTVGAENNRARRTESTPVVGKEYVPTISLALTRFGFEPAEIHVQAQKFYLAVANYTGKSGPTFLVEQNAVQLHTIHVEEKKFRSHNLLELAPGQYLIREEGRTKSQCLLIVEK